MAKDFYETLGVQPRDDVTIIKRRYRELVRQYHPDIATNRDAAHEMMLAINEAWTILSDPAERARYDRSRQGTTTAPPPPAATPPRPEPAKNRTEGWVGSTPRGGAAARPAPPPQRAARGSSTTRTRLLTMVFEAAELYFFQGRAAEAIETCRKVMKYDANNAEAPALLGDIYTEQGKTADAISMYELAVRNQPNNMLYQQKLAALRGVAPPSAGQGFGNSPGRNKGGSHVPGAGVGLRDSVVSKKSRKKMEAAAKAARKATQSAAYEDTVINYGAQDTRRAMAGFIALTAAVALVWWGMTAKAGTLSFESTSSFSMELFLATVLGAFLMGLALPLVGIVGRCGRAKRGEPTWMGTPFIIALAVAGALRYPAAVGLFLIVSLIKKSFNTSTFIVLAVAGAWSLILATKSGVTAMPQEMLLKEALLIWAGRGVLPAMLLGWYLGSQGSRH